MPTRVAGEASESTAAPAAPATPATPATPASRPKLSQNTASIAEDIGAEWRASGEHWERVAAWLNTRRQTQRQRQIEKTQGNPFQTVASEGRTITLYGYGASIHVKHNQLVVSSGRSFSTQEIETETLARGLHGVACIVWLLNGGAGSLSVEALKWCHSQSITVCLITERGEPLAVIHPSSESPKTLGVPGRSDRSMGRPDIHLRRAQYNLQPSGRDVVLARAIIERKVAGQQQTAEKHPELPDQNRALESTSLALEWLRLVPPIPLLTTIDGVRLLEARAARGYFASWQQLPLRVDAKARARWPASWLMVAERMSPLMRWQSPRRATNPGHAMLNFIYGCLESQVRQAVNVIGADPACGVIHADEIGRDSFVLDGMEGLRPLADDLLLTFWQHHVFGAGDFQARSDGSVAIHPSLCRVLTQLCRLPQRLVDDEARWLRQQMLDAAAPEPITSPQVTPTRRRRR